MITKVTITGADDSIKPEKLLELSVKYPFVEWGILVSKKHFGTNRFPSEEWLKELYHIWIRSDIKLSCHLCGAYVRELSNGSRLPINELGTLWDIFERVQINFHGIPHVFNYGGMFEILKGYPKKEFIFQYDMVNDHIARYAKDTELYNCAVLYDTSSGAGILPRIWPDPLLWIPCGYAGGISPENIRTQIIVINEITGLTKTWIDMETHVRSDNDALFDLDKVEECLKIAEEYIKPF